MLKQVEIHKTPLTSIALSLSHLVNIVEQIYKHFALQTNLREATCYVIFASLWIDYILKACLQHYRLHKSLEHDPH